MNYGKIDAFLAAALKEAQNPEEPSLPVFIHTTQAVDVTATDFLQEIGVKGILKGKKIFTAKLSPRAVAELSQQPWVRYVKLSQKLRMVNSHYEKKICEK
ncbi:MAG: hypothetical protein ONB44_05485 [candidate division KSB1 bacterium]|nr:hypothetical protein [candidate division KSB1 bacterium]MDZ7301577.1 hypothetical protein [candidate division KSB1 bacterium]MDZ7311007.1 hypothetical protein [candidate division KSB1 bacterium]